MYSLRKYGSRVGMIGQPLPDAYPSFEQEKATFRRGATSMIAGPPGSFKSVLALNLMTRWAEAGLAGMYFSADSDEFTVARRCTGIVTGNSTANGFINSTALATYDNVPFEYEQTDMEGIATRVASFEAVYGEYPSFIFIDNLMDFCDSGDEWSLMRSMTRELDALARDTKSHVVVLHHTSESDYVEGLPPPRKSIQGKITQKQRLVITVGATGQMLGLAVVKNTNGPQYPNATKILPFQVEDSMRVTDLGWRNP